MDCNKLVGLNQMNCLSCVSNSIYCCCSHRWGNKDKRENEKNEFFMSCQILNLINSILQQEDTEWLDPLAVFTTSPECLYGVSHIALPTKHRLNDRKYYKVRNSCTKHKFTLQTQAK